MLHMAVAAASSASAALNRRTLLRVDRRVALSTMDISSEWMEADGHEVEAALLSASITDEHLQSLAGTHDLDSVRFIQMAVDSEYVPLSCLGERLPALEQLKLNGSSLPSLRYLGTTMTHLRVLWLCRCGLKELDNLGALPELQVRDRIAPPAALRARARRSSASIIGARPACPTQRATHPASRHSHQRLGTTPLTAPPLTRLHGLVRVCTRAGAVPRLQRHLAAVTDDRGRGASSPRPRGQ